jgi:hypothetical protein
MVHVPGCLATQGGQAEPVTLVKLDRWDGLVPGDGFGIGAGTLGRQRQPHLGEQFRTHAQPRRNSVAEGWPVAGQVPSTISMSMQ